MRARAKRAKRAGCTGCAWCASQIEFLPKGILQSAAMAPYLARWRRHDEVARSACASAPTMESYGLTLLSKSLLVGLRLR